MVRRAVRNEERQRIGDVTLCRRMKDEVKRVTTAAIDEERCRRRKQQRVAAYGNWNRRSGGNR